MRHHHHPDGHEAHHHYMHHPDNPDAGPTEERRVHRGGPRGTRRRRGGRGRMARGDVRVAILTLLAERPMHGYELMQAIRERSAGHWTPSPGAVYPAINQLADEGLVTVTASSGRRVAALTDAGREYVENQPDASADALFAD